MKHNLRRVLHLTQARDFSIRAIRAWRRLLPDWTPTLDMLRELDTRPHEHVSAVRVVAEGWEPNDARWDVLLALLEWERREARAEVNREYWSSEGAVDRWLEGLDRLDAAVKEVDPEDEGDYADAEEEPWDREADEALRKAAARAREIIVPIKVTNSHGQVLTEGETTVETPLKAAFLDKVTPVRQLREKNDAPVVHPSD